MGTTFWEVVSDEHGIGCGGEYCGDNEAQLGRVKVFYHGASGGKHVPRAVLFGLRCARVVARKALPPGQPREPKRGRGQRLGQGPLNKGCARIQLNPPVV
jgi:tubulin beta